MRYLKLFVLFFSVIFLYSCTTNKLLVSSVMSSEISDIQRFEPISNIQFIEKGNSQTYSDSLSLVSKNLISEVLNSYKDIIPITNNITITDIFLKDTLEKEIDYLFYLSRLQKEKSTPQLTPVIDSLLEANGKRFGLITMSTGFTRAKYNYGLQVAKGLLIGILTMGMYIETPVAANSAIQVMIVDAKDNNVAFFRSSYFQDKEPLDRKVIDKQIRKIFSGYFWEK